MLSPGRLQAGLSGTPADWLTLCILKFIQSNPPKKNLFYLFNKMDYWFAKPKQSSLHDSLIKNLGSVHVIIKLFVRCIHLFVSFIYGRPLSLSCFNITEPKCLLYLPSHQKTNQEVRSTSKILGTFWRMQNLWRISCESRLQYHFGTAHHECRILQALVLPWGKPNRTGESH